MVSLSLITLTHNTHGLKEEYNENNDKLLKTPVEKFNNESVIEGCEISSKWDELEIRELRPSKSWLLFLKLCMCFAESKPYMPTHVNTFREVEYGVIISAAVWEVVLHDNMTLTSGKVHGRFNDVHSYLRSSSFYNPPSQGSREAIRGISNLPCFLKPIPVVLKKL
ncbi:hypothetical protein L1887_22305 [Cichorium endivia]|nr:hypothetical protein L1887_22305 [Cichorium endivia]